MRLTILQPFPLQREIIQHWIIDSARVTHIPDHSFFNAINLHANARNRGGDFFVFWRNSKVNPRHFILIRINRWRSGSVVRYKVTRTTKLIERPDFKKRHICCKYRYDTVAIINDTLIFISRPIPDHVENTNVLALLAM